jgi:hypothetical protein
MGAINREALKRVPGGIQRGICRDLFSEDGKTYNHARQDCTPVLDNVSRLKGHQQYGSTGGMKAKLVAQVPDIFYYVKWPQEFFAQYGCKPNSSPDARKAWQQFLYKKLDSREFRGFRVDQGKLAGTEQ